MSYDQRIDGTTMIIDLGAENTDLIIADAETVWLRSIPIGGNNFTEALVKSFKLSFDKAEDLKRNAATSKYAKQIFQAMRPVFAELVAEIQRSIGFYASVHRDSRITKVISLGGTFRLPGLQKYLQQNLQLPVERIDSVGAIPPSDAKMATTFNENILSTIGAYGLAIQAMDGAKITSSLLPQAIQRDRAWRAKSKWFAAAAAMVVLGTAGVNFGSYYVRNLSYESQKDLRSDILTTIRDAQGYDTQWSDIESSGADARHRLANVQSMLTDRTLWPKLMTSLYMQMPVEGPEKIPVRANRDFMYVDSIDSQYVADMGPLLSMPADEFRRRASAGNAGPGGAPSNEFGGAGVPDSMHGLPGGTPLNPDAAAVAKPLRGFLITIRCTTPSAKGVNLLVNQYINPLAARLTDKTVSPDRPFYVGRGTVVRAIKLKDLPANAVRPVAGGANGAAAVDPLKDTHGEYIGDDWQATLLIAVIIDPPPKAATPAPTP
jgi:hypothetical protein